LSEMAFAHEPVLLGDVLAALSPRAGEILFDVTVGGAGHASAIAASVGPEGRIYGIDRDARALVAARSRLTERQTPFQLAHGAFGQAGALLRAMGGDRVDMLLADLGVSSPQVDEPGRGFSFASDGPLDMRMDTSTGITAAAFVNGAGEDELADVIFRYGEERLSRRIARGIVARRAEGPISTTSELVEIIRKAYPSGGRKGHGHPARRTFQALRILVNDELGQLASLLAQLQDLLSPGGRAAVITFHSLEDRMVKRAFADPRFERLMKRPVTATAAERKRNRRSRSAKLRAVRYLGPAV